MQKLDYRNVGLILGDPNVLLRQGLKGALFSQGFRDIVDTDKISVIREAIDDGKVDLLICDAELSDGDPCALIHDIRHHNVGNNPFIVTIALIDVPDRELVMRIMGSGADDVLLKPVSAAKLMERVENLIHKRKRFVVTTDYIGPNRRDGGRGEGEDIPEIDVPNPVKVKAEGRADDETLQRAIDAVTGVLNEQKIERHAHQISYLVEHIIPRYQDGKTTDPEVRIELERLQLVSEDISRRMQGTSYAHVGDLCQSMVTVAKAVREKAMEPNSKDLQLMPELARAIKRAFEPADEAVALARDISESVRKRTS